MNRRDIGILSVLIMLLLAWTMFSPVLERKLFPPDPVDEEWSEAPPRTGDITAPTGAGEATASESTGTAIVPAVESASPPPQGPEEILTLTNEVVKIALSTHGAGVNGAVILSYREDLASDSGPVSLNFTNGRALAYAELAGLGEHSSFTVEESDGARVVAMRGVAANGLILDRRFQLDDQYMVNISDRFTNPSGAAVQIPEHLIQLGSMSEQGSGKSLYVPYSLGVDVLLDSGGKVKYLGKKVIPKKVGKSSKLTVESRIGESVEWAAVKNRFFVQILHPDAGGEEALWRAAKAELKSKTPSEVAASIRMPGLLVGPGASINREYSYYVGPKRYSVINEYRHHLSKVMDFGLFTPICKFLLSAMNAIYDHVWPHNYGVAIILITILIRILFWPITHKGTESMRKMQEIQPLMQEMREKYKDNPQKQQQELFALYKEHKINPVGGCLPMVIQIPVFFALFVVLRSAIELRFAGFLWIADLTQPEGLLKDFFLFQIFPFSILGGLNLLPIVMSAMMIYQQKIMPTSADPRQARIMQLMPIFMLFLFYPAPSGLALYWTTNQCSMIAQQLIYKRRKERQEAEASSAPVVAPAPKKKKRSQR